MEAASQLLGKMACPPSLRCVCVELSSLCLWHLNPICTRFGGPLLVHNLGSTIPFFASWLWGLAEKRPTSFCLNMKQLFLLPHYDSLKLSAGRKRNVTHPVAPTDICSCTSCFQCTKMVPRHRDQDELCGSFRCHNNLDSFVLRI